MSALATGAIVAGGSLLSSIANGLFGSSSDSANRDFYREMQQQANEFARSERLDVQQYNSPQNQLRLYSQAGMNPNLLSGQQFVPTTAMNNQSVSPPQAQPRWQFDNLGTSVINGLTQDLQIRKLQGDIKRQDIDNQDAQMQLDAKKMELERDGSMPMGDSLDNLVEVFYSKPRNYYERQVLDERDEKFLNRLQKYIDVDILRATAPILKKIPYKQFESFCQDIRGKIANNTMSEIDAQMMQKYGISSKDQGWSSFFKMALRNPEAFNNILSALANASKSTLTNIFGAVGQSFSNGSW